MLDGREVLDFWYGPLGPEGLAEPEKRSRWFSRDAEFDREIRERFAALHALLLSGQRPAWSREPSGLVAAVIVLDQFSRNMFRGTAAMYAGDLRALGLSLEGIALGYDTSFPMVYQWFLYMPLMHSEDLAMQQRCVELFQALAQKVSGQAKELADGALKYAFSHRDIVERFGRFPHRNEILGRVTTDEELEFLKQPGSSF